MLYAHNLLQICLCLCREQKCIRSQKYASENGLPVLKNVLLPKTKGFCACLEELRGSLDAGNFSLISLFNASVFIFIFLFLPLLVF